jgi:PKD repeat protein
MKNYYKYYVVILIIILVFGVHKSAKALGWVSKADFGGTAREYAVGFSIGSKGYIGTGWDVGIGYRKDFWEYDPATNTWTQKADFGGTTRILATGFSIGNKGYIGTGIDFTGCVKDFWEYNPSTNTWTQKADFGGSARSRATGFCIGSFGYLGTGINDQTNVFYSDFWEYSPSSNTWTQKANFSGGIRENATGFSIGNYGYLGTGYNGSSYKNDFWQYNPVSDTWTQKANTPSALWKAVGFSIDSKGYIGIGYSLVAPTKVFWEYDTTTNTWTQQDEFAGTARFAATGFSIGQKAYLGTGHDINGSKKRDFFEFEPIYIKTGNIQTNNFCIGTPTSISINIPFTISAKFNTGNVFTAQLSDSSGSFTSPQNIGSISDTLGNSISAVIPANQIFGTKYRIRVVSSNPVYIGRDNLTNLSITPYPSVNFNIDDTLQCLADNIFNLSNLSTLSYGTIAQFLWQFGDGATDTKQSTVHTYKTDDTYRISLVCTSKTGCKDSISAQVVVNPSPYVHFGVNDTVQCLKNNYFTFYNFSNISKGSLTYNWDFGNSASSKAFDTSYKYQVYGNYNVRLIATSGLGCSKSYIMKLFVKPDPDASFLVNDSIQCLSGNNFGFLNKSTIATDTFSSFWDFGDGNFSSNFSANHNYNNAGIYFVKLVLNSSYGCTGNFGKNVAVDPSPVIISSVPAENCGPGVLIISAISKNGMIVWYDSDTGNVMLDTGSVFITDTLYKSKTYYAEASNKACSSPRTKVDATIIDRPSAILTIIPDSSYGPDSLTLYAKSLQGNVQWYDSVTGGNLLYTGNYFTTPWLTATTYYFAEAVDRGCPSGIRTAVKASILTNSIKNISSGAVLSIFPNPSKDFITISFKGISDKTSISVIDMNGRIRIFKEIIPVSSYYNGLLDLTSLIEGVYFIIIESRQFNQKVRLIKN